ncbi:MAG: response regulator [Puniceicoccales bacterium]
MSNTAPEVTSNLAKVMPWPYAVCDRHGVIMRCNAPFRQLVHDDAPEMEGESLYEFLESAQRGVKLETLLRDASSDAWHGKVRFASPQSDMTVEALVQSDPDNRDLVWIIVMENPVVNGQMILNPRSELRLLQILMDHTLDYVYFTDIHGRVVITNRAFQSALETPYPGHEVGKSIADFVTKETAMWIAETDQEVLSTLRPIVNRVGLFQVRNGGAHWLQTTKMPVFDHSRSCIGLVSVSRDISEQRQTENRLREAIRRAEQANRAKGEFLANMSHEIRTPINGIIGMSELCLESNLAPDQERYLHTVLSCSNTLLALVNDILDFSKIEAGQLELESIDFDIREAVEDTVDQFVSIARVRGLELAVKIDPTLPTIANGDPIRFRQVLNNLMSNAVKFTEEGEVIVDVGVSARTAETLHLDIKVIDTGVGIDPDRLEQIFDTFTQGDSSTTRKYGGTGLGLSICRKLARMMGGDVSVTSKLGQGATFSVQLTLGAVSADAETAMQCLEELHGTRVLIVDDNLTNRQILEEVCRHWGMVPTTCADGVRSIDLMEYAAANGEPFDLLLLDQQMPGISGTDVASLVNSRERLNQTRMIILTSAITDEERNRGRRMGIARFLSKPVKQNALREAVLSVFGLSSESASASALRSAAESLIAGALTESGLHILLVEDNPINQEVAHQRLKKLGHHVTIANDGMEAVEQFQNLEFDLILMDVQMPRMDGLRATRRIRELEEQVNRHTPIIAMTARAMRGDEEDCIEAGMDGYLTKPFRAEKLRRVLEDILQRIHEVGKVTVTGPSYHPASISAELDEDDREDMALAGKMFLRDWQQDFNWIRDLGENVDFEKLANFAHTVKGTAGLLRAIRLGQIAACTEEAARRHDRDESAELALSLHLEAQEVAKALGEGGE